MFPRAKAMLTHKSIDYALTKQGERILQWDCYSLMKILSSVELEIRNLPCFATFSPGRAKKILVIPLYFA